MFSAPQVREPASSKSYKGTPVVRAYRESQNDGFERGTIRRVEPKEHVFCEGDPKTHVFRIEEGVIALSKLLSDGRRQVIDFAYPGDYIAVSYTHLTLPTNREV